MMLVEFILPRIYVVCVNIGIACGGTGGHVFPGLATAGILRDRGHEVSLWLSGRDVEGRSLFNWTGPVFSTGSSAPGNRPFIFCVAGLVRCFAVCRKLMKQSRPDVVLAMGSYASAGPVLAARSLGVPVVIHEANAVPGRAVELLARFSQCVAVGYKSAGELLRHENTVFTGFPLLRRTGSGFPREVLDPGKFTILVMGGSQGAEFLNQTVPPALALARGRNLDFQVVHLSGIKDESAVRAFYAGNGIHHFVSGFLREMGDAYAVAGLAISRAGAAACAELADAGVPALLIPLPWAARDHQTANALQAQSAGGMETIRQADATVELLADRVVSLASDKTRLDRMRSANNKYGIPDAAEKLADLVCLASLKK